MMYKLGRHMSNDLLRVIDNQDPGFYFSLLVKSETISWLAGFKFFIFNALFS